METKSQTAVNASRSFDSESLEVPAGRPTVAHCGNGEKSFPPLRENPGRGDISGSPTIIRTQ
jgi:hypothetical protein